MMQKKLEIRNSSIELLRIISMIMIVFHHFAVHGEFEFGGTLSLNHFWYNFIVMGGKVGVNIFVLISGYYLIENDKKLFDINKVIKFVLQVFFYSIIIFLIGALMGISDFDFKEIIKTIFPITFSRWWFASAYFVLYLIHPFLNKLLRSIDKGLYQRLLLLLVVCWSIIPTFTTSLFQSNSLLWFITLYVIAGYIKLYGLNKKFVLKQYILVFIGVLILTYSSSIVLNVLGYKWDFFAKYITYFYGQEKITILLLSICLFMIFATIKINNNKFINTLASATFGVYLIHDNIIVRNFLWVEVFNNSQYQENLLLIPYSIVVVTIIYSACSIIDLLRLYIIEKPCMKIVKHYSSKVIAPFKCVVTFLKKILFGE